MLINACVINAWLCHRLSLSCCVLFFSFEFHLYFPLIPLGLIQLPVLLKTGAIPRYCQAKVSVSANDSLCVFAWEHKCWGAARVHGPKDCTPVLLHWPFPLMKGSWQSRGKWCVSVCILRRGVEGKSVWVSFFLPLRPSGEPKSGSSRLLSCYSVMIHDKHLLKWALGCFGLWAKYPCKCSLCVCSWSNTCTNAFQRVGRCG